MEHGKISFEFSDDQYERAHNTMPGKMEHVQDIRKSEGALAEAKKTAEFKNRVITYKEFIQPSQPEK